MNILVCYDNSDASKSALKLALKHATAFDANIDVITVLKGDEQDQLEDLELIEQELEYARVFLTTDQTSCKSALLPADNRSVGENIVRFAQKNDIDQIVMGIKKISKLGKLITGSTARYVILNAPCPVISTK